MRRDPDEESETEREGENGLRLMDKMSKISLIEKLNQDLKKIKSGRIPSDSNKPDYEQE